MLLNKKGFTLIEVLVVVLIIGILAALAAPNIIGRIEQARITNDEAMAKTLENAVASYLVDTDAAGTPSSPPAYKTVVDGDIGFYDAIVNTTYLDKDTVDYIDDNYVEGDTYFAIKGKANGWVVFYRLTYKKDPDTGFDTAELDGGFTVTAVDTEASDYSGDEPTF